LNPKKYAVIDLNHYIEPKQDTPSQQTSLFIDAPQFGFKDQRNFLFMVESADPSVRLTNNKV